MHNRLVLACSRTILSVYLCRRALSLVVRNEATPCCVQAAVEKLTTQVRESTESLRFFFFVNLLSFPPRLICGQRKLTEGLAV